MAAPSEPFTVLLLGSDDDSKFVGDQYNTQSMILVRVDPSRPRPIRFGPGPPGQNRTQALPGGSGN